MSRFSLIYNIPTIGDTLEISLSNAKPLFFGLDHPEGLAISPDGLLYAGGEHGQIYQIDLEWQTFEEIYTTGGFCLGMAFGPNSILYICDEKNKAVYIKDSKNNMEIFAKKCDGRPLLLPNYPVVDRKGNIYISDSGGWKEKNGRLCRFDPNGKGEVISNECCAFTNGLALSPDESKIYVVESNLPGVSFIDLNTGSYSILAKFSSGVPDGIAVCKNGDILVGFYCPSLILHITTSGKIQPLIYDPENIVLNSPTNIAFGGGNTLYAANLGTMHITKIELPWEDEILYWSRPSIT